MKRELELVAGTPTPPPADEVATPPAEEEDPSAYKGSPGTPTISPVALEVVLEQVKIDDGQEAAADQAPAEDATEGEPAPDGTTAGEPAAEDADDEQHAAEAAADDAAIVGQM